MRSARAVVVSVFLFLVACESLGATAHHIPNGADDHGPQLPVIGSSLFDKIYSKTLSDGGAAYDIPYPLEKLLEKLNERGGAFVHTMFPFSRSLQRPQDLSYDPIANPRLVFAPTKDGDSIARGKIFFGFVKARDQLEVISYNDEAGRFEYQIVTDYSKDPKVFYADRGKCLSCHQGQTPIFSPASWEDSSQGVMGHLIVKKVGFTGNSIVNRKIAVRELLGPIESHDNVAMVDALVRESNQIALDERVWVYGCGQDAKCRLGLLLRTVAPNSVYTNQYFEHARQVIEASSIKKQKHFSSFLSSSSFGTLKVIQKYGSLDAVVNTPQAILDIIGLLYNLSPIDNPATLRPESLDPRYLSLPLAGFLLSDQAILRTEVADPNRTAEILIRRFEKSDPLFAADSINKLEVMRAILSDAGSSFAERYSYWLKKSTPEKVLFEGPLPPVFKQSELNLFSRHCSKCHAAGLLFPPQFLLGTENEVIGQMRALKSRILFKLESGLMPPNRIDRDVLHSSGDYDRMIGYLNGL